jgi:putative phosphoesterase
MRIGVISDTHMPVRARALPEECRARLAHADVIVHAGDHSDADSLRALRALGPPVVAVHGNVDGEDLRLALPETARFRAGDRIVAVVHDAGPAPGRLARMRRRFPDADLVVFGHSHVPLVERAPDGFAILNPGSPTDRRRQPRHTIAEVVVAPGRPPEITIVPLGDPPAGSA